MSFKEASIDRLRMIAQSSVLLLFIVCCDASRLRIRGEPEVHPEESHNSSWTMLLRQPGVQPKKNDDYLCSGHRLDDQELYVTKFRVEGTADRAHHMLLYGCSSVPVPKGSWDCAHHGVCASGQSILFAWAKNAPPTQLPPDVGFRIGGASQVKYLVLQIHYAHTLPEGEKDYSGLDVDVTTAKQKYIAGIFILLTGSTIIPPMTPVTHGDVNCRVNLKAPLHLFAYRTHAHALGKVITGYRLSKKTGKLEEIARGNPQWPQAFYGMERVFDVENDDWLFARCTFDSSGRNRTTHIGATSDDEMCNLYLMYYTDAATGSSYGSCFEMNDSGLMATLPADSDTPLPPNPLLEEHALHGGQSVVQVANHTSFNAEKMDYAETFHNGGPEAPSNPQANTTTLRLRMPGATPTKADDYKCVAFRAERQELFVTQFRVEGTAEKAHHMLLYGCESVAVENEPWDCGHHGVCGGRQVILFAWAKNAPPTQLPPDVGSRIGGKSAVQYLVLQIHYAHALPQGEKDYSGMDLQVTTQPQPYLAGIFLMLTMSTVIPPHQPAVHSDSNCIVRNKTPFHMFAFRAHAHALGKVITGYRYSKKTGKLEEIARGNPQWPQAFYAMERVFDVEEGDLLMARCTFDSSGRNRTTFIGATSDDEMCNLYLMYYTDTANGSPYETCIDMEAQSATEMLPADSDTPLPPNPLLEEHALHGHKENQTLTDVDQGLIDEGLLPVPDKKSGASHVHKKPMADPEAEENLLYPDDHVPHEMNNEYDAQSEPQTPPYKDDYVDDPRWSPVIPGQPSAVAVDLQGRVVVFHRGDRVWGAATFTMDNRFADAKAGPIKLATLMLLDPVDGHLIYQAGAGMFYLPHGLTVDDRGQLWVTDVGSHQVFKLAPLAPPTASNGTAAAAAAAGPSILLELGRKLQPGSGDDRFCKPTSVAVVPVSGEFFVADGYCNSRIIKFSAAAVKLAEWGERMGHFSGLRPPPNVLNVPHSLALLDAKELVCVADRENGRVQCFSTRDGQFQFQIQTPDFGQTVYAIAYEAEKLYVVNGPSYSRNGVVTAQGFVLDMRQTGDIVSTFGTRQGGQRLGMPHALALGANASAVYVADINPYRIAKFLLESKAPSFEAPAAAVSTAKPAASPSAPSAVKKPPLSDKELADLDAASFSTSVVIVSVFAVPLLLIIAAAAILQLRRKGGCCSKTRNQQLDLGHLLGHRAPIHGGFEKLAMEDSEDDTVELDSDSDNEVVEFTKGRRATKT